MNRRELARKPWLWVFVGVWAVFVSALHFGGLAYDIYTKLWWWDLLTHTLSGFGVAGVLFLVFPRLFEDTRAPVVVGTLILAIGAGFEVYEYLFKDFWYGWSMAYYVEDTLVDLVVDVLGGLVFVAFVNSLTRRPTVAVGSKLEAASTEPSKRLRSDGGEQPQSETD
ncbi:MULTISPECIES: hypothetical protein [Haloferax]|nr:hypothetical protein [Haloferax mediterranei]AHZ23658.1 hypothetical protein BM92_13865 [Haloferax mediterranei ATCC 33500]MDX5986956.1 hypothetical protein [Haloferax mediterranei ATCC 33500]